MQGLSKFYERTEKWENYKETLEKLMDLFSTSYVFCVIQLFLSLIILNSGDSAKCAEAVQRFVGLQRDRGTRPEVCPGLLKAKYILLTFTFRSHLPYRFTFQARLYTTPSLVYLRPTPRTRPQHQHK